MGFLTASYQAFQYADVEAVLQELLPSSIPSNL